MCMERDFTIYWPNVLDWILKKSSPSFQGPALAIFKLYIYVGKPSISSFPFILRHFQCCKSILHFLWLLSYFRQKLQNRAARVLTFSNYDVNAGQLLEILGWKNLDRQQNRQKATMVFKCLHGLSPDYLASKFSEWITSYNLRDSENKLNVRLPRTIYFKNSFSYSGATLWNCFLIRLQPRTKLLRHFNTISISCHGTIVSKRNKVAPSPPLVQCCFGLAAQACISCVTANNIAIGEGGNRNICQGEYKYRYSCNVSQQVLSEVV